jgi:hypothetical protein
MDNYFIKFTGYRVTFHGEHDERTFKRLVKSNSFETACEKIKNSDEFKIFEFLYNFKLLNVL